MIRIKRIRIQRYRSIIDLVLEIDNSFNLISICGQNNVGKTNTLRAIRLFFSPENYNPQEDMPELKQATWGGAVYPKIDIEFYDDVEKTEYSICRDLKDGYNKDSNNITGAKKLNGEKQTLQQKEINNFVNNIQFFYIEAANLIIPEIIDEITNDMISLEYDKSRFSNSKKVLKEGYETYKNCNNNKANLCKPEPLSAIPDVPKSFILKSTSSEIKSLKRFEFLGTKNSTFQFSLNS